VGELKIGRNHSAASHFAPSSPFFSLFSYLVSTIVCLGHNKKKCFLQRQKVKTSTIPL
jgi:hypothetical protein